MSQATAKVNREVQAFLQDLKGKPLIMYSLSHAEGLLPLCIRVSMCLTESQNQ